MLQHVQRGLCQRQQQQQARSCWTPRTVRHRRCIGISRSVKQESGSSTKSSVQNEISPSQLQKTAPEGWRFFDPSAYSQRWEVPWGGREVATTMAAWIGAFGATAFLAMPFAYTRVVGQPLWELSAAGQADFALWSEVVEAAVTFAVIAGCVYKHREVLQERQLFNLNLSGPFEKGTGWAAWALFGLGAAPLVVGATVLALTGLGYDQLVANGRGTVDGVAGMITMDAPTYVRLLLVTGVLAPLLEETLFRGFLLTSLTKVMPNWAAILTSSTAFGLAHLSIKDLPVLIALGCLLGTLYTRSRNLLTPMIVHGAWNSVVLSLLFWLAANGVDLDRMLHEAATNATM